MKTYDYLKLDYHCFTTRPTPWPGVVSMEDWEQNPDSGISALLAMRGERSDDTDTRRVIIPIGRKRTKPKAEKKPKPAPKPKPVTAEPKEKKPRVRVYKTDRKQYYHLDTATHKFCSCCKQLLPRERFYRDKQTFDGYMRVCSECKNASRAKQKAEKNH